MIVRPPQLITCVASPQCRRISTSFPTSMIFPSLIATASTNDGTPFVAILARCKMILGCINLHSRLLPTSVFVPDRLLLVRRDRRHKVLRQSSTRRRMNHRVGVLDAHAVGAVVTLHDIHHGVVGVLLRPVSLPFQHDRE